MKKEFQLSNGEIVKVQLSPIKNHRFVSVIKFTSQNCNTKCYYYREERHAKIDLYNTCIKMAQTYFNQAQRQDALAA